MGVSRRAILVSGGAAAAISVVGGWATLASPSLSKASVPWLEAGQGFADPRLTALSYAILAPNPHNIQPWQFLLVDQNRIDVFCDLDKRLPETDPFDRQITIGFGCMLELLVQAAAELGYAAQIEAFPDGEPQPRLHKGRIASVTLIEGSVQGDPLFATILERRSTKEPYADRDVSPEMLERLRSAIPDGVDYGFTRTPDQLDAIADNAWRAWKIEQETAATRRESIELMRFGNDEVVAQPDGIDMGGTFLSAMHAAGVVTPQTLDDPNSTAFQSGLDMYRGLVDSTPRWLWLITAGNARSEQLEAGKAWVRLNLLASQQGLAVHPWSHALQEFPEMKGPFDELRSQLVPEGGTVQMFARAGYGPTVPASPRWSMEAKLIDV